MPSISTAAVVASDTVWKGNVLITEDVLVLEGATLTVEAGAVVSVSASDSTKVDPEYISSLTEITIRGTLRVRGKRESPVVFRAAEGGKGSWAGILIDGGEAYLEHCEVRDAETGVYVMDAAVQIEDCAIQNNKYGLVAQGAGAKANLKKTVIEKNDYGLLELNSARVSRNGGSIKNNLKRNEYRNSGGVRYSGGTLESEATQSRIRYDDGVLLADTIWSGAVEVSGTLRVPAGVRLVILPGTFVEFTRRDSNGDGIGESGILLQGIIIAKGTEESPIVFRSAEKNRKMGDWDAVNIMMSDGAQNLVEYCRFEDSYRGLHFHYSNVAVVGSSFFNNYRGVQFQESVVEIRGSVFRGNKSALRARDSALSFRGNSVQDNLTGVNLFRVELMAAGNEITGNLMDGMRVREGAVELRENTFHANRFALSASGARLNIAGNVLSGNLENGISLNGSSAVVEGNYVFGNGISGINILSSKADVRGNVISENDKGIGVISIEGKIVENNFIGNKSYALGVEGNANVYAPCNWWGGLEAGEAVFDYEDSPDRGKVDRKDASASPLPFIWPVDSISADSAWSGLIRVARNITVRPGVELRIAPGAEVIFAKGAGLTINGKITALGDEKNRIRFASDTAGQDKGYWNEIFLDRAEESVFRNAIFEGATWVLHVHFTTLEVRGCKFTGNYGGIRFRGGFVDLRDSTFVGNDIGIRAFFGNAQVAGNVFTGNRIGIFVREGGGGLRIMRNNIYDNGDYNVRVGDFNSEAVDARENWWGEGDPAVTIFDGADEPGVGKVIYEPRLSGPVKP